MPLLPLDGTGWLCYDKDTSKRVIFLCPKTMCFLYEGGKKILYNQEVPIT